MAHPLGATPGFGQADLSNCEREQIHLAGSIQPHGALLVVREPDHIIVQASANAQAFLGVGSDVIGRSLTELGGDLAERIRPHLNRSLHSMPRVIRCEIGSPLRAADAQLHRTGGGELVIEFERAGPAIDLSQHIEKSLGRLLGAVSLRGLCDDSAQIFREVTGYDRVMVYRFDEEGHGEVFSEERRPELEAFLGNRYPASDIPQIARSLYERNRVRVLVDVDYAPVPLVPRFSPISAGDLDMSLCILRSSSPIHVQYLKNMGVGATLVISLMVGGRLWGLISCHHYRPRFVPFEVRAVCELLAEAVATRIAALESFMRGHAELSVRRLEQRMIEAISREGDWRGALFDSPQALLQPLGATGAALLFDDQILTAGDVPGTQELRAIGEWLDAKSMTSVFSTASLGIDEPCFRGLTGVASGLIAAPVSKSPGEYLIWFRPERVRTVTWGGNPFKPVVVGNDPADLSPRRSFAQWHQVVEGRAYSWTDTDVSAARLIGSSVSDVILQFRSVRMLIAHDQLEQVRRQLGVSELPLIIADGSGRILLTNEAFARLAPLSRHPLQRIEDITELFTDPAAVRQRLTELVASRLTWRGEATLRGSSGVSRPVLIRADPVFSSPERVQGFVLLFTDLTARKAAEFARQRFQDGVIDGRLLPTTRLDPNAGRMYRSLLSSIVENAQLAALEITDGVDPARMPELLESVRASVTRTAEMLEVLIWHSTQGLGRD